MGGKCGLIVLLAAGCGAAPRWWMDEPVRLVQTNLRQTDAALDPVRLVTQIAEFPANTLLFGMGGIVAYYPTKVPFHYASPDLPPGRDTFGEVLKEAHARGVRVIGRFDLSKTQKPVYDAHPEWFVRRASGEPVIYNGLYSTCINGGYYREHGLKILTEALERYEVDGLFFNMFGNQMSDYSGNPIGPCRCESCRTRFRARYGRELPDQPDAEYRAFLAASALEVAARFAELIHAKRPGAGFFTYVQQHTDGIMSESNTSVTRALPMWPYSASDNVNRARNSQPDKMAVNLCMSFVDFPWRFATVPPDEIRMRLYENMANGGALAFNMHGTPDQEDRQALAAARPIYAWHQRHQDLYVGQESAARVLLMGGRSNSYRGFFRLLTELHIPFAVSDNTEWIGKREFDLAIAPEGGTGEALERWVRGGGRLLAAGANPPAMAGKMIRRWPKQQGYWRVRDHFQFPSLKDTDLLPLDGEYAEMETSASALTLIPPARFGPPELVWTDKVETDKAGLVLADVDRGKLAYVPWDVGALYYRLSLPAHAGLVTDLIDRLLPDGRQILTNAHPLVEMTLMRQGRRALVHLVNLSGHADTAYHPPVEMQNVDVRVKGTFKTARSAWLESKLEAVQQGPYTRVLLPRLGGYDVIVLE